MTQHSGPLAQLRYVLCVLYMYVLYVLYCMYCTVCMYSLYFVYLCTVCIVHMYCLYMHTYVYTVCVHKGIYVCTDTGVIWTPGRPG